MTMPTQSSSCLMNRLIQCLSNPLLMGSAVLLLLLLMQTHYELQEERVIPIDFYQQPWIVPRAMRDVGIQNIWLQENRVRVRQYALESCAGLKPGDLERRSLQSLHVHLRQTEQDITGSPLLFATLSPLSHRSLKKDRYDFIMISLYASVVGIVLLSWRLGLTVAGGFLVTSVFLLWLATTAEWRLHNVNALQIGAWAIIVTLITARTSRMCWILGGVFGAYLLLFKPNMGLSVLFVAATWIAYREYRRFAWVVGGMAIGTAVGLLVSGLFFGTLRCWVWFLKNLGTFVGPHRTIEKGNFSLVASLDANLPRGLVLALLALCVVPFVMILVRSARSKHLRSHDEKREPSVSSVLLTAQSFALGAVVMVVANPVVWAHYGVLLILPILSSTAVFLRVSQESVRALGFLLIALASMAMGLHASDMFRWMGEQHLERNTQLIAQLLVLVAAMAGWVVVHRLPAGCLDSPIEEG